jgi:benzoate/toluate 1,2-dioxygenase beta subunit
MPEAVTPEAVALQAEVEAFLYREARLLDRQRFSDWLELFTPDAVYWIPSNSDDLDPARQVSIVYDDASRLRERVWRLESGLAYAQEPQSRTLHLVANVEVRRADGDEIEAESAFTVSEFRRDRQFVHAGRCLHALRREAGELRIVSLLL